MSEKKKNGPDENDSGYSEEEALLIHNMKRTKAQSSYRKANAANIPDFIPPEERSDSDCRLRETKVFTPYHNLNEQEIVKFIRRAQFYNFNMEQALALLHANKYEMDDALADLEKFAPLPSRWPEDKSVFLNAFKEEDKYFYAIRDRFFPNRPVAELVEYYYVWKMEKKKRKLRRLLQIKKMRLKKTCPQKDIASSA